MKPHSTPGITSRVGLVRNIRHPTDAKYSNIFSVSNFQVPSSLLLLKIRQILSDEVNDEALNLAQTSMFLYVCQSTMQLHMQC